MADFCKECFDKEFGDAIKSNEKVVVSKDLSFCEGCGDVKQIVLKIRKKRFWEK